MRTGRIVVVVGLFVAMTFCYEAQGQEALKLFWQTVKRDTARNNIWPSAFKAQPRIATRAPFNMMVYNGWRLQNMLDEHHFDPQTGELTHGGQYKVKKVMFDTPLQHRTIYVRKGATTEVTTARVQAVSQFAEANSIDGKIPTIYASNQQPQYHDAARINAIQTAAMQSVVAPRLTGGDSGE